MSYLVASPYAGLGAATDVRAAIQAGTYPGNLTLQREWLSKGTWHGALPRGFASRAQSAAYGRCLIGALPTVPAGTQGEQAAFVKPFGDYCKSMAAASGGEPILGGPAPALSNGGMSTGEMLALGIGALVVLGVSVYSITRLQRKATQTMYAKVIPGPWGYRGLGGSISFSIGSGGGVPTTDPGTTLNNGMAALLSLGRKDTWVTGSSGGGGKPAPVKHAAAIPPKPADILPAIPPGMYPGTDDHASQMRIYGTVNGAKVRGFTPDQLVQFIRCVNAKLPQGLPAQSKWQREIALGPIRYQCMIQVLKDPNAKDAPAADAVLALSRFRLTPAMIAKVSKATAPVIPVLRLPGGLVTNAANSPPVLGATTTGTSATDIANQADANATGADIVALGLTGPQLGMAAAGVVLVAGAAYALTRN